MENLWNLNLYLGDNPRLFYLSDGVDEIKKTTVHFSGTKNEQYIIQLDAQLEPKKIKSEALLEHVVTLKTDLDGFSETLGTIPCKELQKKVKDIEEYITKTKKEIGGQEFLYFSSIADIMTTWSSKRLSPQGAQKIRSHFIDANISVTLNFPDYNAPLLGFADQYLTQQEKVPFIDNFLCKYLIRKQNILQGPVKTEKKK